MYTIGAFVGALLITILLTQLALWLLRHWDPRVPRILVANGLSLFISTVLAGFGQADGSKPDFQKAFATYVIPQILCLIVGLAREGRAKALAVQPETLPSVQVQPEAVSAKNEAQPYSVEVPHTVHELKPGPENPLELSIKRSSKRHWAKFIVTHWRGEFPLWVSYWIFGFLANVAGLTFADIIALSLTSKAGYNPQSILAIIAILWLGIGLIVVWQLVGVWRSATRYTREHPSKIWGGLAKLAVILGALRLIAEFMQSGYPQMAEASRMAFLDDPDIPPYAIRIMRNGTEVEVSGGFKYGLDDDFVRILKAAPQVKVVHLNSDGGRIGEAKKLNRSIQSRNLITYTSNRCSSACTIAFAAGRERWIHPSARLGFHAPAFPGMSTNDLKDAVQDQRTILAASGVSADFISKALATPSDTLWQPTIDELLKARMITGVADSYRFAASGWGPNISRDQITDYITKKVAVFAALRDVRPAEFTKIMSDFSSGYLAGESEGNLIDASRARVLPIIQAYRSKADDQTLLELGKLLIEQYKALALKDKQLCYEYASGVGGAKNYSTYLSEELRQRELAISERILRTASQRPVAPEKTLEPYWKIVGTRLAARYGRDKLELLTQTNLGPTEQAQYCDLATAMFQEILALGDNGAAMLLRANFSE